MYHPFSHTLSSGVAFLFSFGLSIFIWTFLFSFGLSYFHLAFLIFIWPFPLLYELGPQMPAGGIRTSIVKVSSQVFFHNSYQSVLLQETNAKIFLSVLLLFRQFVSCVQPSISIKIAIKGFNFLTCFSIILPH